MEGTLNRTLAVILHADVAGSTALVQRNETLAHRRVREAFVRLSEAVRRYGGEVLETRGDAVVVSFPKVSDAVCASLTFQQSNAAANDQLADDIRPEVRLGVAMGEVIVADATVTGEGVVLAQRLEQLAEPGGLVIQGAAYDTVPKRLPFDYESLGEQALKGFDRPVQVHRVTLRQGEEIPGPELDLESSQTPGRRETAPLELPEKPSIAVLPFTNMSDDVEQEYFSDGITEDITTALSYFSGLFVIARNSSFTYKGQAVDARRVGEELGVRYLLEGSVRRMGGRLRITAQLIDTTSGNHLWAEKFDGDASDIFDLQDEITRKIVASIAPRIELAEVDRGRTLQPAEFSSYELSLKAKSQMYDAYRAGDLEGLDEAIATAAEALEKNRRNTVALHVLAWAQLEKCLYRWGDDPDEELRRGVKAAEGLIQVDPSNAEGFAIHGMAFMFQEEFDLAVADMNRALSLNQNSVTSLFSAAWAKSLAGLTSEAREHAQLGLRLSPREDEIWLGIAYLALTQASFADEDFEQAMKWGRLAIQMTPKAPIRRTLMIACCAFTDRPDEGARHFNELRAFAPDFIGSILRGDLVLYKEPETNVLLIEGLRRARVS